VVALGDIAADNMWMTGSSGHFGEIYKYTANESTVDLLDMWSYGYKVINGCTELIKAGKGLLATVDDAGKASIQASIAQAYALKSLANLALVNIFGLPYSTANAGKPGIVIVDTEPIASFATVSRSSVSAVYAQILKEIGYARADIDLADKSAFTFNTASLDALEARVKLYMGDMEGAITAAQAAIDNSGGELVMEIDKFNFVCNIMGEDLLTGVRRDLGME
jgi:hypothetical protein